MYFGSLSGKADSAGYEKYEIGCKDIRYIGEIDELQNEVD